MQTNEILRFITDDTKKRLKVVGMAHIITSWSCGAQHNMI